MLIYLIVFLYYLFLCVGVFYIIRINGYYKFRKIKEQSRRKKIISGIANRINFISHKVGKFLIGKYRFEIKDENIEILKLLEFENKIFFTFNSFVGYKIILLILLMIAGGFAGNSLINSIIFSIIGGAVGYFIPDLLLKRYKYRRQKEIDRDLPYVIDLLSIATLSGQNIYNAIKIVIEKYRGSICAELSSFIKDVDIGVGKYESYMNLMNKNNSEGFKNFIFILLQAEKYGSSINEILEQKTKHMKFETYQKLERKARRITLLTLFPLVFLILPSFVILVGGPLIFSIGGNFLSF